MKTIIFVGSSGCGKGTQAELVKNKFKEKREDFVYVEVGAEFRDLLSMTTDTAKISKKVSEKGHLQPSFLAIFLWAKMLNLYYSKSKHLIIDGSPRSLQEANILNEAFHFYGIEKPTVVYIEISRKVSKERILLRKRQDDKEEIIENRLDWFDQKTKKAINFLEENDYYNFVKINGEQSVEKIFKDIEEIIF